MTFGEFVVFCRRCCAAVMTLNVRNHENELRSVFQQVTQADVGRKWAILEYEGNSNILRVGEQGDGGLEEFSQSFEGGKLQYGIFAIKVQGITYPKVVLIHWQGEGVPVQRLSATASHATEIQSFFKTVHVSIHARNEYDVESKAIMEAVMKSCGSAALASNGQDQGFVQPEAVGSVYRPVKPHKDINVSEREQFWKQQDEEEKRRLAEEQKRQQDETRRMAQERENMVSEFQRCAAVSAPEKITTYRTQRPVGADSKSLVSGRAQMFSNLAKEQEASMIQPKKSINTGKPRHWEIKKESPAPLPSSSVSGVREEPAPVTPVSEPPPPPPVQVPEPVAAAPPAASPPPPPPAPVEPAKTHEVVSPAGNSYSLPPEDPVSEPPAATPVCYYPSQVDGTRAIALWDYQAEEDNEISFEPDEVITEIEMIDEGWWRGRGPNGNYGLFPANYVKLL
ncbi:hypothetical protein QR680_014593 [Steinernema hermaphroditum]|uniref:SH3 domain-containing protein n=1 Tax=Steinernema hermaphroditum TaxID=289476 RepID=A0AA39IBM8_9BILA|nr:hypothetical protein QR680_014593 [Steinernema hermaphroditum]